MEDLFAGTIVGTILLMGLVMVIFIPVLVVYFVGFWNLLKKAGRKGWEAIIPFYNTWVLAEIAGVAWWYALIIILSNFGIFADTGLELIISLAAIIAKFFIFYNLSKKFHRDTGLAVLMIFFPLIMIPILGLSNKFQYDSAVVVGENGPIDSNNIKSDSSNSQENTYSEESKSHGTMNFCPSCGNKLERHAKFCSNCGREIQ